MTNFDALCYVALIGLILAFVVLALHPAGPFAPRDQRLRSARSIRRRRARVIRRANFGGGK